MYLPTLRSGLRLLPLVAFALAVGGSGCSGSRESPFAKTALTAATHEGLFPIAAGPHADIDCQTCHGDTASFSDFSCVGCHNHSQEKMDPKHPTDLAPGYTFTKESCYGCHPRGERGAFDHQKRFPIAQGTVHQDIACTSCHPNPTSRKEILCTNCHTADATAPRHTTVQGYLHSSSACYSCHPDAKVALTIDHALKFPIGAGTKHSTAGCVQCHTTVGDKTKFECITCHFHEKRTTELNHGRVGAFEYKSSACYSCHKKSEVVPVAPHTQFPIAAGDRHTGISCATCHTTPGDRTKFDCISCHTHEKAKTDATHAAVPAYSYVSADCYSCHPNSQVTGVVNHTFFPIGAGTVHGGNTCAACHTVPGNRKVTACAGACHPSATMGPAHTNVGGYTYDSAQCKRCHADSQVNRVAAHTPFGITSTFKHFRKSCFECHPSARADKAFGTDFGRAKLDCYGACHEHPKAAMDSKHQGRVGYAYVFTTCINAGCHQDGRQ